MIAGLVAACATPHAHLAPAQVAACTAARGAAATVDRRLASGALVDVLDLGAWIDRACGTGGEVVRERALAGLGVDAATRAALAQIDALETSIGELERRQQFGAPLRARYRQLDDATERAERGLRASGLAGGGDLPPATASAWLHALLLADAGDLAGARAVLEAIPAAERRPGIDVTLAILARDPVEARRDAARAVFAVERAAGRPLVPRPLVAAAGDHEGLLASPDRRLLAELGDRVQLIRTDTFEVVGEVAMHAPVTALAFGSGGHLLATADADGRIEVRELVTWRALRAIDIPGAEIGHLALVGGVLVATPPDGEPGPLTIVDLASGKRASVATVEVSGRAVIAGGMIELVTPRGLEGRGLDGAVRWTIPGDRMRVAESGRAATRDASGGNELLAIVPSTGEIASTRPLPLAYVSFVDDASVIGQASDSRWLRITTAGEARELSADRERFTLDVDDARRVGLESMPDGATQLVDLRDLHVLGTAAKPPGGTRLTKQAMFALGWRWPARPGEAPTRCTRSLAEAVVVGASFAVAGDHGYELVDPQSCRVVGPLALAADDRLLAAWPDGRTAVVRTSDGIAIVDLASGARTAVPVPGERAAIGHDGHAVVIGSDQVSVVARDGTVVGKQDVFDDVLLDPLGQGVWVAGYDRLRHRPDPLAEASDLELPLHRGQPIAVAGVRRFASVEDGAIVVVDATGRWTLARPGVDQLWLTADGTGIALPRGDDMLELVDVATGETSGWLVARGRDRWLRLDGNRATGSELAIGEPSILRWRAAGLELPGWVMSIGRVPRGRR